MKAPRNRRGQAIVELSVAMLIIVPTFMYVLFLDDLLAAKLDMQEAVITAPWEYARVNFEEGGAGSGVRSAVRLGWCDHTTTYNSYDRSYDCQESVHHVALAAHQCWLSDGAKQVSCSVTKDYGKLQGLLGGEAAHSNFTTGGLVRCWARLGVINYFLPQKLFEQFTKVDMTRTKKGEGDVHKAGKGLAVESHYLLEEQQAGLVVDTWALGTMSKIGNTGSGKLKDRTNSIYQPYFALAAAQSTDLAQKLGAVDVVNPLMLTDAMGDNPADANVAFDPDNETFNGDFHGSPYEPKLGSHYMGQDNLPE